MSHNFSFEERLKQANQFSGKGSHQKAAELYRECLHQQPSHEWVLNNLGFSLNQLGRFQEAIGCLQPVVLMHPDNLTAHANLAAAWEGSGEKHEALSCRRRLTEIKPDSADFHGDLANLLLSLGRTSEALKSYQRASDLNPKNRTFAINLLLATNYSDALTAEEVAEAHFRWWPGEATERRPADTFANDRTSNRRLRIGYVSTDFSNHPVGKLMVGILSATKAGADNYCYSDSVKDDPWTARIKAESHEFKDTRRQNDADFCRTVIHDGIDILVDLNGHTGGRNRLGAFAIGAAPVQTSFLGYPNTTGHPAVDYYISDEFCTPTGMSDHLFRETLWRLPGGCLAFQPAEVVPLPTSEPYAENNHFTFGSFNNPSKVSPATLQAWSEILKAVPTSRLQVRYAKAFRSSVLRERWADRLCCSGVDPDRICFITNSLPYRQHLETFTKVDLCLDPFPYQGTMTTLESLYMGSPVLTKAGRNYCQRASSSLLLRLGENQLVTGSVDEYIEKAVEFACFPDRLRPIRTRIREHVRRSRICDVNLLGQELLEAYGEMWERWCSSGTTNSGPADQPQQGRAVIVPQRVSVTHPNSADCANTVWIASYPKSGNTWVRFLLTNLLSPNMTSSADVETLIPDVHKTNAKPSAVHHGYGFAKTHFLNNRLPAGYQSVGAIYVYRDPLDVLASHVNYFELAPRAVATASYIDSYLSTTGPPRWAEFGFGSWEEHIRQWCLTPQEFPVLAVSYESLQADAHAVLRKIAKFLDISASEVEIAAACEKSAADSLRQLEATEIANGTKGFFTSERQCRSSDFRFINAARSNRAREVLPEDVIERAEQRFRHTREALNALSISD